MTAREAMTQAPLTATPRTSVATALRLARDNRMSRHERHDALDRLTVERADLLRALVLKKPEAVA